MFSRFQILPPQQIPAPKTVQATLSCNLAQDLRQMASARWASNADAAQALLSVLDKLNHGFSASHPLAGDDNAHDEYFGIERAVGSDCEIYLQTVLRANLILFEDAWHSPFTISPDKLSCLDSAFSALLQWTIGSLPVASHPRIADWKSQGVVHHSMTRWIRGHQIFAALTQGLIAVFRALRDALRQDNGERIEQAANLAVLLLHGSAASLEFTGDFPSTDYTGIIRPSMTPPLVPDTFSGLLSIDHRFFIQLLREMKPLLDSMAERPDGNHQRIAAAVASVYDSHRFVCDRLVGKCPSLMMASGSKKSGAEQIEKFKHLRLKVFETERLQATVNS